MHDLPIMEALRPSFVGCLRNVMPFLIYGLVLGLFLLSLFTAGLLFIVTAPVVIASIFVSYRDIFVRPATWGGSYPSERLFQALGRQPDSHR